MGQQNPHPTEDRHFENVTAYVYNRAVSINGGINAGTPRFTEVIEVYLNGTHLPETPESTPLRLHNVNIAATEVYSQDGETLLETTVDITQPQHE